MMIGFVWICIVCFALDEVNGDQIDEPSCAIKWMEVHDVYSLGAKMQIQIRSVDECREFCIKRLTGCVAIDVHGNFNNNCFTHIQSLDKLEKNRIPHEGYTQLLLIKECSSSTLAPTTNIYDNTLPSFTQTDESYFKSFTETDGRIDSSGDISEYSSSTLASTAGTDEISSTVSSGISDEPILLPAPETDCLGLFDDWEEFKDTYTPKAKLYSKVRDADACKRACVEEIPGCVAVMYHVSGYCWYRDEANHFGKNGNSHKDYVTYVRISGCKSSKSVQQPNSLLHLQLNLLG